MDISISLIRGVKVVAISQLMATMNWTGHGRKPSNEHRIRHTDVKPPQDKSKTNAKSGSKHNFKYDISLAMGNTISKQTSR